MKIPGVLRVVTVLAMIGTGVVVAESAQAAALTGVLVAQHSTSAWGRPSPDPSGITYDPSTNQLIISDGEVEETPLYAGTNLFVSSLTGVQSATFPGGTSLPWSDEPTGVSYRPSNGHLYVSDDDADLISDLVPGADGRYGTADDTVTSFTTRPIGGDAEDVTIDMDVTNNGHLLVIDGVNKDIYDYGPGPNGVFDGRPPAGDDTVVIFDVGQYGAGDPEGIEYYPGRNTIIVLDDSSGMIYELNRQGGLLNTVSIAAAAPRKAAGITLAPASNGSGAQNLYIVDRGVDNDSNPNENDGRFYEMSVNLPPIAGGTNAAPVPNAGPDLTVNLPNAAALAGTINDDGLPNPPGSVTAAWSKVSGPGDVTFAQPNAVSTSATFSGPGSYVLRLTGNDGQLQSSDDVSVVVGVTDPGPGGSAVLDVPVRAGADDAEERSASNSLTSGDLNLVLDGNTVQTVGMRFTGVTVPRGATVTNAYVQFQVDEASTAAANLTVAGQAADNPPTFAAVSKNISSRPRTTATVGWVPASWPTAAARTAAQRTPDLKSVIQEIVDRSDWDSGDAMVLVVTGTGERTAEAFEGGAAKAAVLHLEYGTTGTPNTAPVVDAGTNFSVTSPDAASLAGSVTDDGRPTPPGAVTAAWEKVTGPGTASFADATSAATTATFSAAGSYVLRLTGNDGALSTSDEITVTVADPGTNVAPVVSAGNDTSVTRPAAASLSGTVSDDGLPNPPGAVTAAWTQISGPGTATFADATAAATTVTFSAAGSYELRLTGSDGALSSIAQVTVIVSDPTNVAPVVSAGNDTSVTRPAAASLAGSVTDDGLPAPPVHVTAAWTQVSGPGTATFANAASPATTATFSAAGSYVLRLTGDDGALSTSDEVTVTVADGGGAVLDVPVRASADDAEERTSTGAVTLTSGDLNLGTDAARPQTTALRFTGVTLPPGATITAAWVQFQVDEASAAGGSLTVAGQAADSAGAFTTAARSLSTLPRTTATVSWSPVAWPTIGARTADQRTPNLAAVIQEIVGRTGWASDNALALLVTGDGSHVAEAFDGGAAKAPVLHIEYTV